MNLLLQMGWICWAAIPFGPAACFRGGYGEVVQSFQLTAAMSDGVENQTAGQAEAGQKHDTSSKDGWGKRGTSPVWA